MNLFLIDIDGALVDSESVDMKCYTQAVQDVLGIHIEEDWSHYRNVTDSGVLDEIITKHKITDSRSLIHRQVEARYLQLIQDYLAKNPSEVSQIQGAKDFIDQMREREDTHVAIATGGWESAAKLKLRAAGIDIANMTFASSSDAMSRTEIMALAAFRAKQDSGATFQRRVLFGHGTWNKHASQELGYDFVEVGDKGQHHHHIPNLVHYQAAFSQLALQ
ncbi:HAD hydrolase-like protein [Photobacterium alginatilyticum]|uniref:Haloacid dehalogenase-like hydrolase n=1 Tax=Photobacterium alginatilyticum TaxID=1775171 RepID=A0ABW9YI56_9GAMM|nr:HAD hydrolase-like protein [Photobacterium alginatilyticum]NBI53231.1 haloacid dehalogenase-like hydrolase [Photobacterium alginatilyticum]